MTHAQNMAGRNLPIKLENNAATEACGGGSSAMPTVQKMPVKTEKKNKAGELVKRDRTPVKTVETAKSSHRESLEEQVTSGAKRKDKGKYESNPTLEIP
jgi:hypothetical protein